MADDPVAPMPVRVRRILCGSFAGSSANRLIVSWNLGGRPNYLNPGPLFGEVLAWLWRDDRDEAMRFIAGFLAELNIHHEDAGKHGPVGLEETLEGLRFSVPRGFDDLPALCEAAVVEVPEHYGGPV